MIGIFDSGVGGLTVARQLIASLPLYSYIYLGDNARAPYGPRSAEEIYAYTTQCLEWLFAHEAKLVIVACNTASATSLRRIQQEWLPAHYPDRAVIGILVPAVEAISGVAWNAAQPAAPGAQRTVLVFASTATVTSGAYTREIQKRNANVRVVEQACPRLAELIELDASFNEIAGEIRRAVQGAKEQLGAAWPPQAVILGCTHYPIVADIFMDLLPADILFYSQADIVAEKTREYLSRHPRITEQLRQIGGVQAYTTGDPAMVGQLSKRFFDLPLEFRHVALSDDASGPL